MSNALERAPEIGLRAIAVMVAAGLALGVSTNFAKLADRWGASPVWFLAATLAGAALLLVAIAFARRQRVPISRRCLEYYVVAGFVGVAAPNYLGFLAAPRIGAGFVALSFAFPPLFTYLGALCLGMDRWRAGRAVGVLLSLAGVTVLASRKLAEPGVDVAWVLAVLAIPLLLAIGNLYRTIRWPPGATPEQLAPGTLAASVLMVLVAALSSGASVDALWSSPGVPGLIAVQAVAFAAFFLLFFVLQKIGGPIATSLTGSVGAAAGTVLAVAMLGEALPAGLAVGATLIAAGIALVMRR